jgi:hypothetical protein
MIKAITLNPFWAWAVCHAGKNVENRTQKTHHRGPLAIHAGQGNPRADAAARAALEEMGIEPPADPVRGAIVARVDVLDCVPLDSAKVAGNRWASGPECFVLGNLRNFRRPVPAKGQQGFFYIDLENV